MDEDHKDETEDFWKRIHILQEEDGVYVDIYSREAQEVFRLPVAKIAEK